MLFCCSLLFPLVLDCLNTVLLLHSHDYHYRDQQHRIERHMFHHSRDRCLLSNFKHAFTSMLSLPRL